MSQSPLASQSPPAAEPSPVQSPMPQSVAPPGGVTPVALTSAPMLVPIPMSPLPQASKPIESIDKPMLGSMGDGIGGMDKARSKPADLDMAMSKFGPAPPPFGTAPMPPSTPLPPIRDGGGAFNCACAKTMSVGGALENLRGAFGSPPSMRRFRSRRSSSASFTNTSFVSRSSVIVDSKVLSQTMSVSRTSSMSSSTLLAP
mmetsp:Transcript_62578/g.174881  ORF Transcript_62578/g.174881 Transcript_62578/m.174881 type:complete len:201 (-) Transcript_62578:41-643(-)